MKIKAFDISYLSGAKSVLKDTFFGENKDECFNEMEFAENMLKTSSYPAEL